MPKRVTRGTAGKGGYLRTNSGGSQAVGGTTKIVGAKSSVKGY